MMHTLHFKEEIEVQSNQIGFSYPQPLKDREVNLHNIPILLVRVGKELNLLINKSIDRFLEKQISLNQSVEFINYPEGQHGFDVLDDTTETREIIKRILEFIKSNFNEI